jgi:hypothetical protein
MTSEQIQAELSKRAGGDLSGIPHRNVSYALPLALGAAAILILVFLFRRLGKGRAAPTTPTGAAAGAWAGVARCGRCAVPAWTTSA